ncbi:MAG: hypothetical protein O4965_32990 [Trichodesmium sp. St19_bin1]|nr:hypothetical protein [Trichodesmium sp. St19_bin1]
MNCLYCQGHKVVKNGHRQGKQSYSAFQIDKLHRHNQNPVGTLHGTSLPWSTDMKTAVKSMSLSF